MGLDSQALSYEKSKEKNMLNIIIIVLILAGLTVHRYLSGFWEEGRLPWSVGFLVLANLFFILYLVNFIWLFGLLAGIIIWALAYFQILYGAVLWVFLVPWYLRIRRDRTMPGVSLKVQFGFGYLVMILGVITAVNFFLSSYMSGWEFFRPDYKMPSAVFFLVLIVGNMVRILVCHLVPELRNE